VRQVEKSEPSLLYMMIKYYEVTTLLQEAGLFQKLACRKWCHIIGYIQWSH